MAELPTANKNRPNLLTSLLTQAELLLTEISDFQAFLRGQRKENQVELRSFRSNVLAELKALKKFEVKYAALLAESASSDEQKNLSDANGAGHAANIPKNADPGEESDNEKDGRQMHALRSSNIPFLHTLWTVAKQCPGMTAMTKRYYLQAKKSTSEPTNNNDSLQDAPSKIRSSVDSRPPEKSVLVDIVSADGSLWTKISLISERRLIFDMAKEGYGMYDSESEAFSDEDDDGNGFSAMDSEPDLEIIRIAADLRKAALVAPRVNYEHPRIRLVLPRLSEGSIPQIDGVLSRIRRLGVEVICENSPQAADIMASSLPLPSVPTASTTADVYQQLTPTTSPIPTLSNDQSHLTSTLNLDCTILLALLSDISHLKSVNLPAPPSGKNTFHAAVRAQIAAEASAGTDNERLLSGELWPIMRGRRLVTMRDAAVRMAEIVRTIGTDSEKKRVEGLFGKGFDIDEPLTSNSDASIDGFSELEGQDGGLSKKYLDLLQSLSDHPLPTDLVLPVQIIDLDINTILPPDANDTISTSANDDSHEPDETNISTSTITVPLPPVPTSSLRTYLPTDPTLHPLPSSPPSTPPPPPIASTKLSLPTLPASFNFHTLPSYTHQVSKALTMINRSVFLSGWALDIVTLTSNRSVAREIETIVCKGLDDEEELLINTNRKKGKETGELDHGSSIARKMASLNMNDEQQNGSWNGELGTDQAQPSSSPSLSPLQAQKGPRLYVIGTARSLIGKEKGHR